MIVIERMDGGPRLVIEHADQLAVDFFTRDPSSVGPYAFDAYVGTGDPERITTADIVAINTTMRARSPHEPWAEFVNAKNADRFLVDMDVRASLFRIGETRWHREYWPERLSGAIEGLIGPHRNLSVVTKVLHAKRPRLFPVLDSLVVQQLGGVGRSPRGLIDHVRAVGILNRDALRLVSVTLEKVHVNRSEVRILDALL
jgi:Family of unknown function (DUF6308)